MSARQKLTITALFFVVLSVFGSDSFWIQDGDELLFWGNSITDDGIYTRVVENYILTYYPHYRVKCINLGWGGDRASYFPRLERDIALSRPDKVTILLGMNDGRYGAFLQDTLANYQRGMKQILKILKERSDPDILLMSPTPLDLRCRKDIVHGLVQNRHHLKRIHYPATLKRFTHALHRIAEQNHCKYLDLNASMTFLIEDLDAYNGNYQVTAEGVHPNIDGEFFMGLALLDAMGANHDVMRVALDAQSGSVRETFGCQIKKVSLSGGVSFVRLDERLPMAIYPAVREDILRATRFFDLWNRDLLTVTGLDSGWYELKIDDRLIDILHSTALEQGVNLSTYFHTPMMTQAYQVFEATEKKLDAFYAKWRYALLKGVRRPNHYTPFHKDADTLALGRAEQLATREQYLRNQPRPRRFALNPVRVPDFSEIQSVVPCQHFLDDRIRIHLEIDSRTLRRFTSPLCIQGNFTYAPQYQWSILEIKPYYSDIPVMLYDDGTHGDRKASDGVFSIDLYLRKNAGTFEFQVQDGRYLNEYYIKLNPQDHVNPDLKQLTQIWGELSGRLNNKNRIAVETDRDVSLKWDRKVFRQALDAGLFVEDAGEQVFP